MAQTWGIQDKRCPCPRERQAKCSHSWYFNGGRHYRFSVDMQLGYHVRTQADAMVHGQRWLDEIGKGTFMARRERIKTVSAQKDGPTLAEFAKCYLAECSVLKSAGAVQKDKQHRDHYVFQPLLAFELSNGRRLGTVPFAAITEAMYEEYISARREDDYAASTVNKDVGLIAGMCRWAARRGWFGPHGTTPISGESKILRRKTMAMRQRPVSDAEFAALQTHSDPILWAYIRLSLITCARLTELYRLRWADHQGLTLRVRSDATKVETGARLLPLDDEGIALLGWLRIDPAGTRYPDSDFILGEFGERPRVIRDRFRTMLLKAFPVRDQAGQAAPIQWSNGVLGANALAHLERIDLRFGDFRHEGALRKYRAGWLLNELQRLLGHTNIQQTSTYLGVGNEEVLRAMARHGSGVTAYAATPDCHKLPQNENSTKH